MRKKSIVALFATAILFGSSSPTLAEEASPSPGPSFTRAEQVAKFHAKYDSKFNDTYARFMAIEAKITYNASMKSAFKAIIKDFKDVRTFIENGLASNTEGIEVFVSYAEEELGEFDNTIYLLEKEIAKSKTITCVKGKTTKKIMALKPKCPTGYKKK